jgi:hypothetical protein
MPKQILRAALVALLTTATMTAGAPGTAPARGPSGRYDLRRAFDEASSAEIFVARRGLETPGGMDPAALIDLGCRHLVRRGTPAWRALEREVAGSVRRPAVAEGAGGEVWVGLVLRSRVRTVTEMFSATSSSDREGFPGFVDGRRVRLPPVFASALVRFAGRFSQLAIVDPRRPELCER